MLTLHTHRHLYGCLLVSLNCTDDLTHILSYTQTQLHFLHPVSVSQQVSEFCNECVPISAETLLLSQPQEIILVWLKPPKVTEAKHTHSNTNLT